MKYKTSNFFLVLGMLAMSNVVVACDDGIDESQTGPVFELPELYEPQNIHTVKPPLTWSPYEICRNLERAGVPYEQMDISSDQWDAIIDMVATKFKPYGYDIITTDGFIPQTSRDGSGFMTHYGSMPLEELARRCKAKGLRLGIYDNPFWLKEIGNVKVPGTKYNYSSLVRNGSDIVLHPDVTDRNDFCYWLVTDHPGAKEYIDAFFKHYADLGVALIRMDFLGWYEDGNDPFQKGYVTCGYGRDRYERGLAYLCEAAQRHGIYTCAGIAHLYHDAELESKYLNSIHVVGDADVGGWDHFTVRNSGLVRDCWPYCDNQFDGMTYWNHKVGKGKVAADGDFLMLNRCTTDAERRSQVSLMFMGGSLVSIADTPETIGTNAKFYTNEEILALNADWFVGRPLSDEIGHEDNNIWYGSMSNGDVVMAVFNRTDARKSFTVDLSRIGMEGDYKARDLWVHRDLGTLNGTYKGNIPAHDVRVIRFSKI